MSTGFRVPTLYDSVFTRMHGRPASALVLGVDPTGTQVRATVTDERGNQYERTLRRSAGSPVEGEWSWSR